MKLSTLVFRTANRMLAPAGLTLGRFSRDFDSRLADEADERRIARAMSNAVNAWFREQSLFTISEEVSEDVCLGFYRDYLTSAFRTQRGSSRFNNLFSLFAIARAYRPDLIIDSGTFEGASAWALKRGCPSAKVMSFDIDMSRIAQRTDGVEYIQADWSARVSAADTSGRTLAYFDDHVEQVRRLLEAQALGVELAVFDDDFPVTSFAGMAHDGAALPKIEFVLDDDLRKLDALRWSARGKALEWPVDVAYLDRGRAAIAATDRMPNTSLVTDIHQTPYRVVRL